MIMQYAILIVSLASLCVSFFLFIKLKPFIREELKHFFEEDK